MDRVYSAVRASQYSRLTRGLGRQESNLQHLALPEWGALPRRHDQIDHHQIDSVGADDRIRTCDEHGSLRSRRRLSTNFSTSAEVPCARFELAMSSLRTRWRWPLAQHGMAPPMGIQPTMTRSTGGRLQQPTPRAFEKGCGSGESNPGFNHGKVVRLLLSHYRRVPESRVERLPRRYQRGVQTPRQTRE
jgi:hypothetical protein